MLAECKDNELLDQIKRESQGIANQLPSLETALLKSLLPKDSYDHVHGELHIFPPHLY